MLDIFQYDFMVRALLAGLIIGVVAPMVGIFLVVRRYALMADTLAHISLAGVAIAAVLGIQPIVTAAGTSVVAALGIEQLRSRRAVFGDSVLALFLTGSLALAIVLFSTMKGGSVNVMSYLFGSITTVSTSDLRIIIMLGVVAVTILVSLYRYLFAVSYDEEVSRTQGIPARLINLMVVLVAAVTVALAMRIVGSLLVGALMVIPVTSAMQFRRGFRATQIMAVTFSLVSVFSGIVLSYVLNLATGGAIVLVAVTVFLASLAVNRKTR